MRLLSSAEAVHLLIQAIDAVVDSLIQGVYPAPELLDVLPDQGGAAGVLVRLAFKVSGPPF